MDSNGHIKCKEGNSWEFVDDGFFRGYVPVEVKEGVPAIEWTGGKLTMKQWNQVLCFFKRAYEETKSEVQVRLLYNKDTGKWIPHAFPQKYGTGMMTKEIYPSKEADEQREQFSGYMDNGTIHSHCDAPAFQSGGDKENELTPDNAEVGQIGLHVTIGNLANEDAYSIHGRVYTARNCIGAQYPATYSDWVECPKAWSKILLGNKRIINMALEQALIQAPKNWEKDDAFPEIWMDNLIKESTTTLVTTRGVGFASQSGFGSGFGTTPSFPKKSYTHPMPEVDRGNRDKRIDFASQQLFDFIVENEMDFYETPETVEEIGAYYEHKGWVEKILDVIEKSNLHRDELFEVRDALVDALTNEDANIEEAAVDALRKKPRTIDEQQREAHLDQTRKSAMRQHMQIDAYDEYSHHMGGLPQ